MKLVEVKSLRTAICSLPRTEFSSSYAPRYFILVTPFIYLFPSIFPSSWGRCSENIFLPSDSHTRFTTWSTFGLLNVVDCLLSLRNVGLGSHCLKALPAFRDSQEKRGVLICSLLPVSLFRAWGVCPAPDSSGSRLLRRSPKALTVPEFFLSAFQGLSETPVSVTTSTRSALSRAPGPGPEEVLGVGPGPPTSYPPCGLWQETQP